MTRFKQIKLNMIQIDKTKTSALSSTKLDKYEYLTDEDLGYKPSMFGKAKFQQSLLGIVLVINTNSLKNKNKTVNTNKQDKNLFYNSQNSFVKFKDINDFKEFSLDSMHKKLNDFPKKFTGSKNVSPQTKTNGHLKEKVLYNGGDLFNDFYYN